MKRLVVTADDFGMSVEVNEAVEQAHREGVLTCASLVVSGAAVEDAVRRAQRLPGLGIGLHLALFGAPACAPGPSPLTQDGANLGDTPARTGVAIMLSRKARNAARTEIAAQFDAYRRTGLGLGHLDGHWHCHQHPAVLAIALELGRPLGLKAVRVPYEPFAWSSAVSRGSDKTARALHAATHWPLAMGMRRQIRAAGMIANHRFFGKNDAGHLDESLLLRLAAHLEPGLTEVGLHPATTNWEGAHAPPPAWRPADELAALTSTAVRGALKAADVVLSRWEDAA